MSKIVELWKRYGFHPRKRWGQNFLVNERVAEHIVEAAQISKQDTVLEIGPGLGILTRPLLKRAKRVIAVEIDSRLSRILEKELGEEYKNLILLNSDILKLNLREHLTKFEGRVKVVTNLPYFITTPTIFYLLENSSLFSAIFLTVQYEVAKRMVASPGSKDYGVLSIFVQYFAVPKILFRIKPGSFFPIPKVSSALVQLDIRSEPPVRVKDENFFFTVVRTSFEKRRKMLRNELSERFTLSSEDLEFISQKTGIDLARRAETLSFAEFSKLSEAIEDKVITSTLYESDASKKALSFRR